MGIVTIGGDESGRQQADLQRGDGADGLPMGPAPGRPRRS
jgi:hypothetical protein